jgi:sec-independent protein translocase protein TatA
LFTNIMQPSHLLIVLIVALLFLGPKRLPGAGRALGQGLKEFRNSISGDTDGEESTETPALAEQNESASAQPSSPAVTAGELSQRPAAVDRVAQVTSNSEGRA